jgi:uroporphyrinogen decarboxylase
MLHRERFRQTMGYGTPDRVPYFEEGIRDDVLEAWHHQGLSTTADLTRMFPSDPREEIAPELDPRPKPDVWPETPSDLVAFAARLDPADPARFPDDWPERIRSLAGGEDTVRMLRVHRGLFLSTGVYGWNRLTHVMVAFKKNPDYIHETMAMWSRFNTAVAERVLKEIDIDAAIFSEPIGGNEGPLISPHMYEAFVLSSYRPLLDLLHRHGVETLIFRTYANARLLIPSILKFGFNCLWACEVHTAAMDYADIRREFGRDLRLIGGIDLDALRQGREAVRRELEDKVPPLLADGGYVPLADGRVRTDIPFEDYKFYRELLSELIS